MYYSHFGLSQAPFKITPNTEFFFSGGNRGPILEALIYAITHGEGIIKVTGEVGSGKTMLCHMLPTRLPAHIETVYIANPSVSPEEIVHAIAFELQLDVDRGAPRLEVMQALHDFLLARCAEGKRVVVFVEESQSMPIATLEEIRLLSNLETRNDKLLQIVLFGQPELDDNLRQPNIRQLRERITHSFRLEPLTPGEIREYLMFRMRAAGYRGPDLFTNSVVKHIARTSLGLTRRVNLIADKALLAAFSENTHTVKPKHVEAAVRDSEFSQQMPHRVEPRQLWSGAALVGAGAVLGIAIYALLQHAGQDPATAARVPATDRPDAAVSDPARSRATPPAAAATAATAEPVSDPGIKSGAPAVGGDKSAAAERTDLLEARLAATRDWLAAEAHATYSIQLMGTNDPEQLREQLNALAKFIEINSIFVYRTVAKQKPSLTVLYGSYTNPRAAREALDKLPESLKVNRPLLRTVQGIRAEIRQHQAS
ncbi:MAG: general secretion pathway protein [Betaproteobacteria bacterium RIFCSPLOWO2_02_FULL_67_26]|nr:MAG: general secretion pathway protein [Betaproteobacteria bacterium RIFCSPLOWO2_02_FULL_67_26]